MDCQSFIGFEGKKGCVSGSEIGMPSVVIYCFDTYICHNFFNMLGLANEFRK